MQPTSSPLHSSATAIPDPPVAGPSAADIAKVVEEYKAREERKHAKEKGKGGEAKEKDKDVQVNKDGDKGKASPTVDPKQRDSPATPVKADHRRYELHRALFSMRQRELRMREQAVHAKERSKGVCLSRMGYWVLLRSGSVLRITPSPKRDYLRTLVYTNITTSYRHQFLSYSSRSLRQRLSGIYRVRNLVEGAAESARALIEQQKRTWLRFGMLFAYRW